MALRKIFFCMFVICFMSLECIASGDSDDSDTEVDYSEQPWLDPNVFWIYTLQVEELQDEMRQLGLHFDYNNEEYSRQTYAQHIQERIRPGSSGTNTQLTLEQARQDLQVSWIFRLRDKSLEVQMYRLGLPFEYGNLDNARLTYAHYIKVYRDTGYLNRSPLRAVGEKAVCPEGEGPATYVMPNPAIIPMYCNGESRAYCNNPSRNFRQKTYFFVAYIQCRDKAYAVILNNHLYAQNVNIILDVVTLPKLPFPTRQLLEQSITPMMINVEKFIIYYKKEDGSCIRRTYKNIGYNKAHVTSFYYNDRVGDTCVTFQAGINTYNYIDRHLHSTPWFFHAQHDFLYICQRRVEEAIVDCSEKDSMVLVEYA